MTKLSKLLDNGCLSSVPPRNKLLQPAEVRKRPWGSGTRPSTAQLGAPGSVLPGGCSQAGVVASPNSCAGGSPGGRSATWSLTGLDPWPVGLGHRASS